MSITPDPHARLRELHARAVRLVSLRGECVDMDPDTSHYTGGSTDDGTCSDDDCEYCALVRLTQAITDANALATADECERLRGERARIVAYIRAAFPNSRIARTIARDIEVGAPLLVATDSAQAKAREGSEHG